MENNSATNNNSEIDNSVVKQDLMHGSIFIFLKRFVESNYNHSTWENLLKTSGIQSNSYGMHEMYPTDDLFAIVGNASELTGIPMYDFMELFGEFLVPDLLQIYKNYIKPEWCTYEMLLYTEEEMHGAVKQENARTTPPRLYVMKQGEKRLIIEYYSKRRMAGVAVGIIRGIAKYYNEEDKVLVIRLSDPHAENVKILVDFIN